MNATNDTMVTTTTIRSRSMQFLLVRPRELSSRSRFSLIRRLAVPALGSLCCQAQDGLHRKRLGYIRKWVKFRQPARADEHGRQHHHRQLLALSRHNQWLNTTLAKSSAQDIPTRLVG